MAEPLFCTLCGAEDYECGHAPSLATWGAPADEGPAAFCEISACALWRGERCAYCEDAAGGGAEGGDRG